MPLNFDISRLPDDTAALEDLVKAIAESNDREGEQSWLEWKSDLDLSKSEGRFKLAKEILGLANRDVHEAQRFCGGWGYVVVGASENGINRIKIMKNQEFESALGKYLGTGREAPSLQFDFVLREGDKGVLVIRVAPPRDGDPIYVLNREWSNSSQADNKKGGHKAGTVFVRGNEEVQPADPSQMRMLQRRLMAKKLRDCVMERIALVCSNLGLSVDFDPLLSVYHGFAMVSSQQSERKFQIWVELLMSGSFDDVPFLRGLLRPLPADRMLVVVPDYLSIQNTVDEVKKVVSESYGKVRDIHGGSETGKFVAVCNSSFGSIHDALRVSAETRQTGVLPMRSAVAGVGIPSSA